MFLPRLRTILLAVAASGSLAACAYDDGYGYGGMSVGYGYPGYDPYYDGGYYGYDYGYPGYGWFDNFYYPGVGIYVYDRGGHRHRWSERQRRYWRQHHGSGSHGPNWGGYHGGGGNHGGSGGWNHGGGRWNGSPNQGQVNPPPPPAAGRGPAATPRPPVVRDRSGPWGGRGLMRAPRAPRSSTSGPRSGGRHRGD